MITLLLCPCLCNISAASFQMCSSKNPLNRVEGTTPETTVHPNSCPLCPTASLCPCPGSKAISQPGATGLSACQSQGLCGPSITQRKWDFTAHFSTMTRVGGNPMARTGAVWMISIWHSSTFNHSWFRFQLLVHLDLCRWFNKQTQYIVHHANCIIKLLTYFQTSSFYSSVPLSFPSFPLFSFISNPRRGFAFFPKPESIKDPIMSEVSPAALQTAHCWRIFPEVV